MDKLYSTWLFFNKHKRLFIDFVLTTHTISVLLSTMNFSFLEGDMLYNSVLLSFTLFNALVIPPTPLTSFFLSFEFIWDAIHSLIKVKEAYWQHLQSPACPQNSASTVIIPCHIAALRIAGSGSCRASSSRFHSWVWFHWWIKSNVNETWPRLGLKRKRFCIVSAGGRF